VQAHEGKVFEKCLRRVRCRVKQNKQAQGMIFKIEETCAYKMYVPWRHWMGFQSLWAIDGSLPLKRFNASVISKTFTSRRNIMPVYCPNGLIMDRVQRILSPLLS
jgi:arginine decarboxylase-like protein